MLVKTREAKRKERKKTELFQQWKNHCKYRDASQTVLAITFTENNLNTLVETNVAKVDYKQASAICFL